MRLRTATNGNNGFNMAWLTGPIVTEVPPPAMHLVWTFSGGEESVYKDGELLDSRSILDGDLSGWDDTHEVIIGTDLGVWATGDYTQGSPSWIQTNNGMSDVTVVDLDLRSADDVILASTHGRGFFTSQFTSVTLSVAENSFNSDTVSIFPTVSDGKFTLTTQRALGNITFSVYDLSGKKVYGSNFDLSSNRRDFNLDLNSGLYIIKINSENSSITKRIIIK